MAISPEDMHALTGWAVNFTKAVQKVKEGAEAPGSAITLSQEECQALVDGLRIAFKVEE